MPKMRAKMVVSSIEESFGGAGGAKSSERLTFNAVANCPYPPDGSDEDNTYARWSPQASLQITVANPDLWDQFKSGEKYYVDFSQA